MYTRTCSLIPASNSPHPDLPLFDLSDGLNSIGFCFPAVASLDGVLQISITGFTVGSSRGANLLRITSAEARIAGLLMSDESPTVKKPPMKCSSTSPKVVISQTNQRR